VTQSPLETDLITTPERPSRRELDEDEILSTYGRVIWEALVEFARDPTCLAEMVEAANVVDYKAALWKSKRDGAERPKPPLHLAGGQPC